MRSRTQLFFVKIKCSKPLFSGQRNVMMLLVWVWIFRLVDPACNPKDLYSLSVTLVHDTTPSAVAFTVLSKHLLHDAGFSHVKTLNVSHSQTMQL